MTKKSFGFLKMGLSEKREFVCLLEVGSVAWPFVFAVV